MLTGVKVIDFSNYLPGPYATLRLAELGAEVIKIEPINGDPARYTGIQKDGIGVVFLAQNRGKKSVAINLKTDEGREIAFQLISKADVVMESFRPGVMKKLGLDFEAVQKVNPSIVYCSITGYGDRGTLSKLGSHDLNYMGVSGVLSQLKDDDGKPVHPSLTFADYFGGFAACERVLSGLISKFRTGTGSYHCISIADVMASILGNHLIIENEIGYPSGIAELNGSMISYHIYETKDSRFVTLAALESKFWRNFCTGVDKPEWVSAHYSRSDPYNAIFQEIVDLFSSRTLEEWIEFGKKVDCCLAPILEVSEVKKFSPFVHNKTIFQSVSGVPQVKMHGNDHTVINTDPPQIGEHSFQVLEKELKISREQFKEWKEKGVLF